MLQINKYSEVVCMVTVIKKDGTKENFNFEKIICAVSKSAERVMAVFTQQELEKLYSPLHTPANDSTFIKKNVVVFILESFGKDYIGAYNPERKTPSLTPFLDSLITESRTYAYSYGNGRKSIDGMPSVLSSIPMFVEPFFVTPASLNRVSGIAGELQRAYPRAVRRQYRQSDAP